MKKQVLIIIIAVPVVFFFLFASWGLQDYKIQESRIFTYLDTDSDDVIDLNDNCPNKLNPNQKDFDGDNLGDVCDIDIDNDGIVNPIDAFSQNPEEWDDFDFDGIGANEDEDDDNDGILDINDPLPLPVATQLTEKYPDLIENCAIMDPGFPRQLCYRDFFVSLVKKGESSVDIIKLAFFFARLDVIDDCHFTAHHVGYASFQENPDLTEILMSAEDVCRNGFYHGVLMALFDNLKKDGKEISNLYKTACDEFVNTRHFQPCQHGVGHGLVFYYKDDLRSSVDTCHELSGEPFHSCINGVMMQYAEDELTESTSFEEVIPEICSVIELSPEDTHICNLQIGRNLAFITNHDKLESERLCNTLDGLQNKFSCISGLTQEIGESMWQRENAQISYN